MEAIKRKTKLINSIFDKYDEENELHSLVG